MAESAPTIDASDTSEGYARVASSGTRWTTAQSILNKIATAFAMIVIAFTMTPTDFGLASVVVVVSGFIMVLPVYVMGDVLIAHQRHKAVVIGVARRVIARVAIVLALAMIALAPLIGIWFDQYPFAPIVALLAFSAGRPIADALMVVPVTRMRIAFRFREIAVINGISQLGVTVTTVVWALLWPSAAAIVVPQVLGALIRSFWFLAAARHVHTRASQRTGRMEARHPDLVPQLIRRVSREFSTAALGQYLHTVVSGLPLMMASQFVSESATGEFSFAFSLANQASAILAYQLGIVLQPIFGRLKSDPSRQISGFMRVVALMSSIMIPIAFLQAALGEPMFVLLFPEKWMAAVPIFVAFSVGLAFALLIAPSMALLKAQGSFTTYFIWQIAQAVACLALFPMAALMWGGLGIAWTDTILWAISVPLIVWLGSRGAGVRGTTVLRLLLTPWLTAAPIAIGAYLAWQALPGPPKVAAAIAVFGIGPVSLLLALLAVRFTQPGVFAVFAPFMARKLKLIPGIGRPLAVLFTPTAQ